MIIGMMHLVWAGGGFRAVARVVLAEVHLLVIKIGIGAALEQLLLPPQSRRRHLGLVGGRLTTPQNQMSALPIGREEILGPDRAEQGVEID